jgi:pimeloyl-ACP methyl ester carboxylesterase
MAWHGEPGRQLYYEDYGRGDAVVLMPGWSGNIVEFGPLREELQQGFRVIAVDLPGSGRSQPQPRHYDATYYLDDARNLLGLLDALRIDVAHLAGFSDGGEEALLMAALEPHRALSVLTWGAAGRMNGSEDQVAAVARVMDDPTEELRPLAAYLAQAYGPAQARVMTATWADAMRTIIADGGDISRSMARRITCPALLITGTYDRFCPPDQVREMAEAIPRGEFREAAEAGHDVHVSHQQWLTSAMTDWLGSH